MIHAALRYWVTVTVDLWESIVCRAWGYTVDCGHVTLMCRVWDVGSLGRLFRSDPRYRILGEVSSQ